ncbi:uncharacterized [Tachysurus ichikawai]
MSRGERVPYNQKFSLGKAPPLVTPLNAIRCLLCQSQVEGGLFVDVTVTWTVVWWRASECERQRRAVQLLPKQQGEKIRSRCSRSRAAHALLCSLMDRRA